MQDKYKGFSHIIPDRLYIQLRYFYHFGHFLNLKNPKTINEKLNWLKLYYRNPIMTKMVDKHGMKEFVTEKIGPGHVIEEYGCWSSFDEIDFDSLPDQFVLKTTHDCAGEVICLDKANFDKEAARKKLNEHLKIKYFYIGREWAYKNVKPQIIAERYMPTLGHPESREYKFSCSGGKCKIMTVCSGQAHVEFSARQNDHYNRKHEILPFTCYYENSVGEPAPLPEKQYLDELIRIAETLSKDLPCLRVDMYLIDGVVYVGELTCYTWDGLCKFDPPEWDLKIGRQVTLPPKYISK